MTFFFRDMEERFTYDLLNRLTGIVEGLDTTGVFAYDAYGRMTSKYLHGEMVGNDTVRTKVYAGNWMYYVHPDHLGSWTTLTAWNGNVVQDVWFDPWGTAHNITPGGEPSPVFSLLFDRGFTGHEHMREFGLINMNGRVYDPVTSSFLSVDNYVQDPSYTQNFNRYAYCMNNPLKYTDPDGEFFILDSWIVGFVSKFFQTGSFKQSWSEANSRAANDAKIWGGLFVTDSNKGFWGRTWELISRFTWQAPQTVIGWAWSQSKNIVGAVDRVDYLGGATFVTNENWKEFGRRGVTIGNYINIDMHGKIDKDNFTDYVTHNQLYMHEYGHYIQSQRWGPLYIPVIGLPSFISAARDKSIPNDPYHASTHDYFWTEYRANRNAAEYFNLHYDVVWNEFGFPLDDYRQVNKH